MIIDGLTTIDGIELDKDELASIDSVVTNNLQEQITNISLTLGPQGDPGVDGTNGADGSVGTNGVDGVDGAPGAGFTIGTTNGDMKYWDGLEWADILAPVGSIKASPHNLLFCQGIPTWSPSICPLALGDIGPGGGIVFYITDGGFHGLEAAPADHTSQVPMGCVDDSFPANGSFIGTGKQNTDNFSIGCAEIGTAVKAALNYAGGGFNDWFLPSRNELLELFSQSAFVTNLSGIYWSSTITEAGDQTACSVFFSSSAVDCSDLRDEPYNVRFIRAF